MVIISGVPIFRIFTVPYFGLSVHICYMCISETEWNNVKYDYEDQDEGYALHLKGQMMYMTEWQAIIFLGTPM